MRNEVIREMGSNARGRFQPGDVIEINQPTLAQVVRIENGRAGKVEKAYRLPPGSTLRIVARVWADPKTPKVGDLSYFVTIESGAADRSGNLVSSDLLPVPDRKAEEVWFKARQEKIDAEVEGIAAKMLKPRNFDAEILTRAGLEAKWQSFCS